MEWVMGSNADVIWDSVKSIFNAQGTTEIYPRTDALWANYAKHLSKSAETALNATQAKDKDALFVAGGNIYNACKACHDKYTDFDKQASK
jgi:cytochrome c556